MFHWSDYTVYTACIDTPHAVQCGRVAILAAMCAITLAVADGVFVVYLVRSRVYHGHRIVLFTSVLLSTLYVVTHGVEACKTGQISIVTVITASAGIALFVFSRLCSINLMYQLLFGIRAIGNLLQLISATQLLVVTIFFAYFAVRARDVVSGRMESSVRFIWSIAAVIEVLLIVNYIASLLFGAENCYDIPMFLFSAVELVCSIGILVSGTVVLRKLSQYVMDMRIINEKRVQLYVLMLAFAASGASSFTYQVVRFATFSQNDRSYASNSDELRTCVDDSWGQDLTAFHLVVSLLYQVLSYFVPLWAITYIYRHKPSIARASLSRDASLPGISSLPRTSINEGPSVTPSHVMAGILPPLPTSPSMSTYTLEYDASSSLERESLVSNEAGMSEDE